MKQMNSKKAKKISSLQKLLHQNKQKFTKLQNGKIKCVVTGHEFMPTVQNLQGHLKSKSYKKAMQADFDIIEYEKVLQTHKQNKNFLFCRLTGAKIPKKKTAILKHISCKRFQTRYQQYLQKMGEVSQELQNQQQDIQEQEQDIKGNDSESQQNQQQGQSDQSQQESQQSLQIKNKNKNGKNNKKEKQNNEKSKNKQINKNNQNKKSNYKKNGHKNVQKRK